MENFDDIFQVDLDAMTYRQLLDTVTAHGEIIVTLAKDDVAACKRGLTVQKSRDKSKFTSAGLEADADVLRFYEIPIPDEKELIKLHIVRGSRKTVKIHSIQLPDNEL